MADSKDLTSPYHDYIVLITSLDAEWSREACVNETCSIFKIFENTLTNEIDGPCERLVKKYEWEKDGTRKHGHLFAPKHFIPFGHADVVAITLVDSFESIHEILVGGQKTSEDVIIGFCPDHLANENSKPQWYRSVKEHFWPSDSANSLNPLVYLTRFKFAAPFNLTYGLLMEKALYDLVTNEINSVVEELKKAVGLDSFSALGLTEEDIRKLQVSFVDLQGQEDFGLLISVNHPSIIAALLTKLRSLTFDDLQKRSDTWLRLQYKSNWWNNIVSAYIKRGDANSENDVKMTFLSNHLFKWTRTISTVEKNGFDQALQKAKGNTSTTQNCIKGFVLASTEMLVSPGHQNQTTKELAEILSDPNLSYKSESDCNEYHGHVIGGADMILDHANASTDIKGNSLVPLEILLMRVAMMMEKLPSGNQKNPAYTRDLMGLASRMAIPLPKDSNFQEFLYSSSAQHKTFIDHKLLSTCVKKKLKLEEDVKVVLGPSPHTAIHFLDQNIRSILSNPLTFDSSLDLYDVCGTYIRMINEMACNKTPMPFENLRNPDVIERLSFITDALASTLQQRMHKAYPEESNREMAIDYRGGLQKLIHSVDSVLKLGCGMLRTHVLDFSHDRHSIGVLPRISIKPGIYLNQLFFDRTKRCKLAIIRMDVPHIAKVPQFLEILHETFHLIYQALRAEKKFLRSIPLVGPGGQSESLEKIVSEISANLFLHLLLSRDNSTLVSKYLMLRYYQVLFPSCQDILTCITKHRGKDCSPNEHEGKTNDFLLNSIENIASNTAHWFVAEYLASKINHCVSQTKSSPNHYNAWSDISNEDVIWNFEKDDPTEVTTQYEQFLEANLSRLVYGTTKLPESMQEQSYQHLVSVMVSFFSQHVWPRVKPFLRDIAIEISGIYGKYRKDACQKMGYDHMINNSADDGYNSAEDRVKEGFLRNRARPISGGEYEALNNENRYDGMLLLSVSLRIVVDEWVSLYNNRFTAELNTPYLISKDYEARSSRLKSQIQILKSYWDSSTRLRGKRFADLIGDE